MGSKKDFIFVEGLEARCVIGIFDWERKIKQRVLIDLTIPTDVRGAARRDRIEDTVNYKSIVKRILKEVGKSRFYLVESLAESIARLTLREFKLREITVRISKPGAIRGAKNVGVQITRTVIARRPSGRRSNLSRGIASSLRSSQ